MGNKGSNLFCAINVTLLAILNKVHHAKLHHFYSCLNLTNTEILQNYPTTHQERKWGDKTSIKSGEKSFFSLDFTFTLSNFWNPLAMPITMRFKSDHIPLKPCAYQTSVGHCTKICGVFGNGAFSVPDLWWFTTITYYKKTK